MSIRTMIASLVKPPLRALRHFPDRLLHTSRRRRTLAALEKKDVKSAVFICHGNINRSAYAAASFSRSVPADLRPAMVVRSAGFVGPGRSASELAQTVASSRGLDLSTHRSRLIDAPELVETDLIVVMNTKQRRDVCSATGKSPRDVVILGDLDPQPIRERTVQDPYGHTADVFERVFDRIDRCMDQLTTAVWKR